MKRVVSAMVAAGLMAGHAAPAIAAGTCAEDMQRFTATWNSVSPQHKTPAANRHYAAAVAAQKAKNDRECLAQLRLASDAMK